MQNKRFFLGILLLITIFAISACTPQTDVVNTADKVATDSEQEHVDDDHNNDGDHDDGDGDHNNDGDHDDGEDDHDHDGGMDHMHFDAPDEFAELINPMAGDEAAIAAGQVTYGTNCAVCHGEAGLGDGPGAAALDPKPATLADGDMMGMLSDGYLFWRVSKGGAMEPFNSAMPAWEAGLTEEQRWQVISYVRTLSGEMGHMDNDNN